METKKIWTQERFFLLLLAIIVYAFAAYARWGGALADDAAFFLQYAKNMALGGFWVWNLGEAPVWGSSAPLFPLFIAPLLKFGVDPTTAIIIVGTIFGSLALSLIFITINYKFGTLCSLIFLIFTALDSHLIWFSTTAGLETPLTFFLLSLGIVTILLAPEKSILIGIIAGLLCVQKLDLIPAAAGLILAQIVYLRRISFITILIAFIIAIIWYGFAWIYFGFPLPNSFLTKALHQGQDATQIVVNTREWFSTFVWIKDAHIFLTGSFIIALVLFYKKINWQLWIFLGSILVSHTIAYTIKFPFEPYDWYCMPSLLSLIILGSISAGLIIEKISRIFGDRKSIQISIFLILSYIFIIPAISYSINVTNSIKHYLNLEKDRENAGRWVSENTPKNFRVFTYWGNPAFFSNRFEYDGSFLNMHFVKKDIIKDYKPEVLILDAISPEGYTLVKIFDKASEVGIFYPFGIHIRSDLLDKVTGIDQSPISKLNILYKDYVKDINLGDIYGTLNYLETNKFFVHPGATKPTSFVFDLKRLAEKTSYNKLKVEIMISPEISQSSIDRGAGDVNVQYIEDDNNITQDVNINNPMKINIDNIDSKKEFKLSIDPKQTADTDWVWVRFYGSK